MQTFYQYVPEYQGPPKDLLQISKKSINSYSHEESLLEMAYSGLILIHKQCKNFFLLYFANSYGIEMAQYHNSNWKFHNCFADWFGITDKNKLTNDIIFIPTEKFFLSVADRLIPYILLEMQNMTKSSFRREYKREFIVYCKNYLICLGTNVIPHLKTSLKNNELSFRMKILIRSIIRNIEKS